MATTAETARTPTHLWVVGVLATLWTAFGCYDYVMTQTQNAEYLKMMGGDEAAAYFTSFPAWVVAFWAIGVWGSLAGSLALLIRSRWAVPLYAVSLLGLLLTTIYQFGMSTPPAALTTPAMYMMTGFIWIIAIVLFLYARNMAAKGVLR
jgi:hypothetical protein